jgi:ribonuclease HII
MIDINKLSFEYLKKFKNKILKNFIIKNNLIKIKSLKKKDDYIECILYNQKYLNGIVRKPLYVDNGPIITVEKTKTYNNDNIIVGIDEAGAGSMISGCYIGSVILPKINPNINDIYLTSLWNSLNDSKKISFKKRMVLFEYIKNIAIEYNIEIIDNIEIDKINIRNARLEGFHRTLNKMKTNFDLILVDGDIFYNYYKNDVHINHKCIIEGDSKYKSIAAASILAKVQRDMDMIKLHEEYPIYNWNKNYGYCTPEHIQLVKENGITKYHRKSYGICRKWETLPRKFI